MDIYMYLKMTQLAQVAQEDLGNTKSKSIRIRSRKWCFTLNNYTNEEYGTITQTFSDKKWNHIIGKEIGENKTPHLQGYIEVKNPIEFNTIKKIMPRAHIEKAKGNTEQNIEYCSKEGNYICIGFEKKVSTRDKLKALVLDEYKDTKWKDWQQSVLDIINGKTNNRTINWYYETKGNVGKSYLCKYIVTKYGAIIADGKKDNIFNQVNTQIENDMIPSIIILDVPRHSLDYINYGVLEQLKNGMIYSGKYEGGVCVFPSPHVFVFCNEEPDKNKMSIDRWNIKEIS